MAVHLDDKKAENPDSLGGTSGGFLIRMQPTDSICDEMDSPICR